MGKRLLIRALHLCVSFLGALSQSPSNPYFVCCFYSVDSTCGKCTSVAESLDHCAENIVQCDECGGFWCSTDDLGDGNTVEEEEEDDDDPGFCCFHPACGECVSRAEDGDFCNELGNCQYCGGSWCENGGLGDDDPDPTPAPTEEQTVPYSDCCVHAEPSVEDRCEECATYVPSTSWCAENSRHCDQCFGTWCDHSTEPPTSIPEPTQHPSRGPTRTARRDTPSRSPITMPTRDILTGDARNSTTQAPTTAKKLASQREESSGAASCYAYTLPGLVLTVASFLFCR